MSQSFTYVFEDGTTPITVVADVSPAPADTTGLGVSYAVMSISGLIGTTPISSEVGAGGTEQSTPPAADNAIFTSPSAGITMGGHTGSSYGLDYAGLLFQTASATYNLYFDSISSMYLLTNETTAKTDVLTLEQTNAPCYCRGTLISTDGGETPVEALVVGDVLVTAAGQRCPVRWIGRRAYAGRFLAANPHVQPVRFRAGSLGDRLPRRDLVVSPDHAMFIDGVLIPARCLVNGTSVVRERGMARVEYFHVELDAHHVILAEGAPSESFLDDGSRAMFHNAGECADFGMGTGVNAVFCAPRLDSGPMLDAVRRHMADAAGHVGVAA